MIAQPLAKPNRGAIASAIKEVLEAEARRNELRIAIVRQLAYSLLVVLDVALYFVGVRPARNIAESALWAGIAAALLVMTAKLPYWRWYWLAVPAVDFFLIDRLLRGRIAGMGLSTALTSVAALSCGLFAATGAIRFDRRAAAWTTGLSVVLLFHLLGGHAATLQLLYSVLAIAAIGMLNVWLADQVKRAMEAARGQVLLTRLLPGSLVHAAFKDPLALLETPRSMEATLLVTDLRGFTALSERMAPGEVFELLNRLQGALSEAVHACGGIVDKFMGDGMLAVFGAPEPSSDHARRAINAVGRIRAALEDLNRELPEDRRLRVGIAVHSGSLVAGCLGGGSRLEFTVMGDAVNTTSRLESMTKEKGVDVLISEATAQLVPGLEVVDLGMVAVRGRQQELRVFTLLNEGSGLRKVG